MAKKKKEPPIKYDEYGNPVWNGGKSVFKEEKKKQNAEKIKKTRKVVTRIWQLKKKIEKNEYLDAHVEELNNLLENKSNVTNVDSIVTADAILDNPKTIKYIVVNKNDRSLKPFVIWLPKPPKLSKIENYGKPVSQQIFRYTEMPQRLIDLEEMLKGRMEDSETSNAAKKFSKQKLQVAMWKFLKSNSLEYRKEIDFIIAEQHKLRHGAWFIIENEIIYISAWHYRYLNYWTLGGGIRPEFRFRDWEYFHVHEYAYRTTEDANYNDVMNRTVIGVTYPKHRRDGATHKSLCIEYSIMMERGRQRQGGIQSYNEVNAFEHYSNKLLPAFDNMPFFLKAMWSGADMPLNSLRLTKQTGIGNYKALNSQITYAKTAKASGYDGYQLDVILTDESGKTKDVDVLERHNVVVQTVALGNRANIFGFMMYPTTVEDMESGGGKAFFNLCKQSHFHDRNPSTGQTTSGLINYFKSAVYGLEGFVDIFGKDVVEDPKESDVWRLKRQFRDNEGKLVGSRRFISSKRKNLLSDVASYNQEVRLFPMEFIECFGALDGDVGFDTVKLKKRRDELMVKETMGEFVTKNGYFVWNINGVKLTSREFIRLGYHKIKGVTDNAVVEWVDDNAGVFRTSYLPTKTNQRYMNNGIWFPQNPDEFTHCGDTFQYLTDSQVNNIYKEDKSRLSKGGLATFWERDILIDGVDKDINDWKSNRFVLDYLHRPPTVDEYCEDVVMTIVYYGGMVFPEVNIKDLLRYIAERGFEGYLLYMTEPTSKTKLKNYAGFVSNSETKQTLFSLVKTYVSLHIHRDNHLSIIKQFLEIKGLEDMTNKDLFVAASGCLFGSISRMRTMMMEESHSDTTEEWFLEDFR